MALDPQTHRIYLPAAQFSTSAFAISGRFTGAADDDSEHDEAARFTVQWT